MIPARPASKTRRVAKARTGPIALLAACLGLSIWASPACAQYFGAIGYSLDTGAMGWGFDYPTADGATRAALKNCAQHAGDCRIAILFKDGCAVVTTGDGVQAFAASPSRSDAERISLRRCRAKGDGCVVQRWVCTTRSMY